MRFQMLSDNGTFFKEATITLSTVRLPLSKMYESCVFFADGNSDVLERYASQLAAARGHIRLSKELGVK